MVIYDVDAQKFNEKLAQALREMEEFQMPEWAAFVKTGTHKVRPPVDSNFWHTRAASILRQIFINGTVGVGRLRTRYGGRKDRGARPPEFRKSSGKMIRVVLQQAEKAGFLVKAEGKKKGRQLTKKGLEFLNTVSDSVKTEEFSDSPKSIKGFEDSVKTEASPEDEVEKEK